MEMAQDYTEIGDHPSSSDDEFLWRYTSLAKLLNMIRMGDRSEMSLVAKRSDKFEDDYEGTLSKKVENELQRRIFTDMNTGTYDIPQTYPESVREEMEDERQMAVRDTVEKTHQKAEKIRGLFQTLRELTYANCWKVSEYEDSNMWRAYTSRSDGVVIKTDYEQLMDSLTTWDENLYVGNVQYIDFEHDDMELSSVSPYFYKQNQFSTESEFRLVVSELPKKPFTDLHSLESIPNPSGGSKRYISAKVNDLIEEVRVHPSASPYLRKVVDQALGQYNDLDVTVEDSSLKSSLAN